MVLGHPMLDLERVATWFGMKGYDRWRTRVDGLPEVMSTSPLAALPREVTQPGRGRCRALLVCSSNLANTAPASGSVAHALDDLELMVSLDPSIGPHGDLLGLRRRGISRKKLLRRGAPLKLADGCPTGVRRERVRHRDRRLHLGHELLRAEADRLVARPRPRVSAPPLQRA